MWGAPDRMQYPSGFLTFVVWKAPEGPQGVAAAYAGVLFRQGGLSEQGKGRGKTLPFRDVGYKDDGKWEERKKG